MRRVVCCGCISRLSEQTDGGLNEIPESSRKGCVLGLSGGAVLADLLAGVGQLAGLQDEEASRADEFIFGGLSDALLSHGELCETNRSHLGCLVDNECLAGLVLGEHLELFSLEFIESLIRIVARRLVGRLINFSVVAIFTVNLNAEILNPKP